MKLFSFLTIVLLGLAATVSAQSIQLLDWHCDSAGTLGSLSLGDNREVVAFDAEFQGPGWQVLVLVNSIVVDTVPLAVAGVDTVSVERPGTYFVNLQLTRGVAAFASQVWQLTGHLLPTADNSCYVPTSTPPTGIAETDHRLAATLFPNPCSGEARISWDRPFDYAVYDGMGHIVLGDRAPAGLGRVSVPSGGVYIVQLSDDAGHRSTIRLVSQ